MALGARFRRRHRRGAVFVVLAALSAIVASPVPLGAHPSDFRTLTLEVFLLVDGVTIDAAIVQAAGPSYEPVPTKEQKVTVARRVIAALGLPTEVFDIDADNSERYHQVGFTAVAEQLADPADVLLGFDTAALQELTADLEIETLKLSLCLRDEGLVIEAGERGRRAQAGSNDRGGCEIWEMTPDAPAFGIAVVTKPQPVSAGGNGRVAVAVALTLAAALAVAIAARRSKSGGHRAEQ